MLHGHPAVLDCAVFGIADERAGEVPVAAVQLDPDHPVDRRRARSSSWPTRLATYKQLRHVVVVDAIPRLPVGQGAAPHAARRVGAAASTPEGAADGRPPLPRAARPARLGRPGRRPPRPARPSAQLDDAERAAKLDAAVAAAGWRELRAADRRRRARGRRASRWRSSPRSSAGAWPTPPSSARPWPPSCAAWPARRPPTAPETVALAADLSAWPSPPTAALPPGPWPSTPRGRRRPWCSSPAATADALGRRSRSVAGGGRDVDLTRPAVAVDPTGAAARRSTAGAGARPTTTSTAWTALGLAADLRRPRRHHARRRRPRRRLRRRAPRSTAGPIGSFQAVQHLLADAFVATEGSRSVALHAAWAVDALAAGRRARRRRRWPRPTAPGPPGRCARPPSRCTAASATPGSAWPTSTCAGRCCRATSSAASDASLARVLAHHGIGG